MAGLSAGRSTARVGRIPATLAPLASGSEWRVPRSPFVNAGLAVLWRNGQTVCHQGLASAIYWSLAATPRLIAAGDGGAEHGRAPALVALSGVQDPSWMTRDGNRGNRSPGILWARGATSVTGHHRVETVEINGIVTCAGVQVQPGDLVVADDSGVAIVPRELVDDVWRICDRQASVAAEIRRGSKKATAGRMKKFVRQVAERA